MNRRTFLLYSGTMVVSLIIGCDAKDHGPGIHIFHATKRFARRHAYLSVNICGEMSPDVKQARFRLNKEVWRDLNQEGPRVPPPWFTIELTESHLKKGRNHLEIETYTGGDSPHITSLWFIYDPSPVSLPIHEKWDDTDLDVQDGYWVVIERGNKKRVRPKPGYEAYDRILMVSGAFPGGRCIDTDVTFRNSIPNKLFGFGVLSLWGGHADLMKRYPRKGWLYGIAWFYSRHNGIGVEFSTHDGSHHNRIFSYRDFELKPNTRYFITVECRSEKDKNGQHLCYRQRMQWRTDDSQINSGDWIELADTEGSPLPESEYAVALVAHRCIVDFGDVSITPL